MTTKNEVREAALPKKEGEWWEKDIRNYLYVEKGVNLRIVSAIVAFIRQHFISRTAVKKIIEDMREKQFTGVEYFDGYNNALQELLEKINKE